MSLLSVYCSETTHCSRRPSKPARLGLVPLIALLAWLVPMTGHAIAGDFTTMQWANQTIHVSQAWQVVPARGAEITICDADSGVTASHPDLKDAVINGINTASATTPQSYGDDDGHGTWTAGIMVARGHKIWGVAPGASLLVAKVFDAGNANQMSVTSGILWCIDQGASVINLSLGAPATA